MIRILLMTISFIAVVVMNTLANTLPLNDQTTGDVSNRLLVLFTPAGYVFSIWSIIYLLLAVWIVAFWIRLRKGQTPSHKITLFFVLSCLFNISWLLLWHYEFFAWSIVAMLGYLIALIALYLQYGNSERSFTERLPISINMGWISVATIANISFVLTFYNWSGWD
ncbi:tryptophan-rich sensory protein [Planococcus faecalis]|uniref:tryptophan-rich sensory protein n=1 Tax=Planococcus faecalis TaxID=1598147 RepID=UPI000ACF21CF|nr:tryptophan-rich sensory protein [Planococcus faecalis]